MMLKKTKLIVLDVDGVLTDGKLLIGSDGIEYKSFNVKDGMGISLARYAGIKFAIITGRKSKTVDIRAKELNIDYVYQGVSNKEEVLDNLMKSLQLDVDEVCYMGDDINDLPVMQKVGLSFAPNDAVDLVKKTVTFVTNAKGGEGAVREMIEIILKSQLDYRHLINEYLDKKEHTVQ